jgi:hypothetical protein
MKKLLNSLLALSLVATFACSEDDPKPSIPESNHVELSGDLSSQTLDATKKYLLKGQVFVQDGSTLTIPAGTVIMGDKATKAVLVVKKGGKLMAQGTASNPIVFTSELGVGERDKGDWGGIVLLGKANVNQTVSDALNTPTIEGITPSINYGTNATSNDDDNSGVLEYVRIEFAGIAISPNNETNSLTMGAVGSGTTINHVQVSFGGDDGFEWFGGTVNCSHLVSFATWDDDFDCDFGYTGKVQYAVAIRDPFSADQSASNGFEVDNDGGGTAASPKTAPIFSNVTIFGPKTDSNTTVSGNYGYAMHLRRNSAASIFNSIFAGNMKGLLLDGTTTFGNYNSSTTGVLANNIIATTKVGTANPADIVKGATITDADARTYWNISNKLDTIPTNTSKVTDWPAVGLRESNFYSQNATYPSNPDLTSVTATGVMMPTASFTDGKLSGFFNTTTFVGAFGTTDWTDGWSNFDPKNAAY